MKRLFQGVAIASACVLFLPAGTSHAGKKFTESFTTTTYKDVLNTTADWNTDLGVLRLEPFVPALVGSYDAPGAIYDVSVDGRLAFLTDVDFGLRIVDIGNPASPTLVGSYDTPGIALGVAVAGNLAFVADNDFGLQIINTSNPASPTLVGNYNTPGLATDVVVEGDLAFVADNYAGLRIISIASPSAPTPVGSYDGPGFAYDVAVAGNLAVVASYTDLQLINITNPASPTLIASYDTSGLAYAVAIDGDLALVADYNSGLQIIDISNPASPTPVGSYDTPGLAYGVAVSGNRAFVGDETAGLQIIDISDPASPTLAGTYDTPGRAWAVEVKGDLAFVADGNSDLQIVRVSRPVTSPALVGALDKPLKWYRGIAMEGDLAIAADFGYGLEIINIANPAEPTVVGSYAISGGNRGVAVAGDLALVANESFGLKIISIANPASPTLVGALTMGGIQGVAVAGDLAFMTRGSAGLYVVNIADPASPALIGTCDTPGFAANVAVAGDLAFVADQSSGLQVISITSPVSPTLVGSCDTPGSALDVAVAGDLAFVADHEFGLEVINIANPASPTIVGTYNTPAYALGVDVAGSLALVADNDGGLQVINIADPANPTLVGSCDAPSLARDVAVSGDLAFVADEVRGVVAIQVLQHEVADPGRNSGRSLAIDGGTDVIRRARLSATQTAGVTWAVSADNGANWQTVTPGNVWSAFAFPGSDLQWRSTHTWAPGLNPTVSDVRLEWLCDYAVIDAITDIANDQGRQVRVEWTRSGHDFLGDGTQIVEYAVYRKIDPDLAGFAVPAAVSTFENLSPAARENARMMLAAGWDFVTTVPVRVQDSYAVVVPTLKDSTIVAGAYMSTFMVTALTGTPGVFFDSPPDSGYSIDNLAPSVPANFTIAYNTASGIALSWDECPNADFRYFRVYRSTDPNFTPSQATLARTSVSNAWVDPNYRGGGIYYKVTATDFSGNESSPASAGTITAVGGTPLPKAFALYPNVPNPFNPTTLIRYDVPAGGGDVSLRIYDVGGRMVKTLTSGVQTAGAKSLVWNGRDDEGVPVASGVYFYRLTAPGYSKTCKMVLMK